jgi:aminoglycoside-2''-adenylyltransferase
MISASMEKSGDAGDYGFLWAWEPLTPTEVGRLLNDFNRPWWIAGGWAIDLFLGRETRRHDDLDVAVLRGDQLSLYQLLADWDLRFATSEHALVAWRGQHLDPPIHGIWARRSREATAPWTCEFLLNEHRGESWVFRRNDAITWPLDQLGAQREGIPYVRPEIVMLYKAGESSPKNNTDFKLVREQLTQDQVRWLRSVLVAYYPMHPWIAQL